jgi:hypothetical protein
VTVRRHGVSAEADDAAVNREQDKPGAERAAPPVLQPVDSGLCLVDGTLNLVLQVVGCVLRLDDG